MMTIYLGRPSQTSAMKACASPTPGRRIRVPLQGSRAGGPADLLEAGGLGEGGEERCWQVPSSVLSAPCISVFMAALGRRCYCDIPSADVAAEGPRCQVVCSGPHSWWVTEVGTEFLLNQVR